MNHLTHQLKNKQHFTEIAQTIALASANNIPQCYQKTGTTARETPYFNSKFFVNTS
jgi:hypothetical protein